MNRKIFNSDIFGNSLAWAGHLVRMNNDMTLKKIFNTKPDGARSVGRPNCDGRMVLMKI